MKRQTLKSIVIGALVGACVLGGVNAYNTNIWSPIQYVKKLFVTSDGSADPSKATIIFDGTNGTVKAKAIYENGHRLASQSDLESKANSVLNAAKSYVNSKTNSVLRSAKSYANSKANSVLNAAKSYANSLDSKIKKEI